MGSWAEEYGETDLENVVVMAWSPFSHDYKCMRKGVDWGRVSKEKKALNMKQWM